MFIKCRSRRIWENSYRIGRRGANLYKANIIKGEVFRFAVTRIAETNPLLNADALINAGNRAIEDIHWWVMYIANEWKMECPQDYNYITACNIADERTLQSNEE